MKFILVILLMPFVSDAKDSEFAKTVCEHYWLKEVYFAQDCQARSARACDLKASFGHGPLKDFAYSPKQGGDQATFSLEGACKNVDLKSEPGKNVQLPAGCKVILNIAFGAIVRKNLKNGRSDEAVPPPLQCECQKGACVAPPQPAPSPQQSVDPTSAQPE